MRREAKKGNHGSTASVAMRSLAANSARTSIHFVEDWKVQLDRILNKTIFLNISDEAKSAIRNFQNDEQKAKEAFDEFVMALLSGFKNFFAASNKFSAVEKEQLNAKLDEIKDDLVEAIRNILSPNVNPDQFIQEFEKIAQRLKFTRGITHFYAGKGGEKPKTTRTLCLKVGAGLGAVAGFGFGSLASFLGAVIGCVVGALVGLIAGAIKYHLSETPEDKLHLLCEKYTNPSLCRYAFTRGMANIHLNKHREESDRVAAARPGLAS